MMTKWKVLAKQRTEVGLEILEKHFIKWLTPFVH